MMTATFSCLRTASALAASEARDQQALSWRRKSARRRNSLLLQLKKYPARLQRQVHLNTWFALCLSIGLMIPVIAICKELNWSIGGYAGQYYDSEPAFLIQGDGSFQNQYIVALTASKTVWRSQRNARGEGSRNLNFLLAELTFSLPQKKSEEVFVRMHHRSSMYDLLNNYGVNGQDFLALGYRRFF